MKIIWFNGTLEQSGGGERLSLEVARCLLEQGHHVYYLVYFYDKAATFEGRYDFINPIALACHRNSNMSLLEKLLLKLKRLFWLAKTIRRIKPDIVLTSGTWDQVVDVFLASCVVRFQYYTHVFGSMFAFTPEKETLKFASIFKRNFEKVRQSHPSYKTVIPSELKFANPAKRWFNEFRARLKYKAVTSSELLFVLSERNRWENQQLYAKDSVVLKGAFPERIFDYRPKQDLKEKFGLQQHKVILSVGRLAENKRVDLAIQSFALICKKRNDVTLVIGGTGPEGEKLKSLVRELRLQDRVKFIGYVDESVLWDYFGTCDAFLHLDLADFDIAPLEALAMGAKVIWSDEMDLAELTSRLNTIWSVKSSPEEICGALEKALAARPESNQKGILGAFTWEFYTKKMIDCILDAKR